MKNTYRFALLWTALVTVIPAVFGVILQVDPLRLLAPGADVVSVLHAMGLRNFAFSAILLAALLTQPKRVVAFLLFARGLTEWADGLSGVFMGGGFWLVPAAGGLGDLLIGYYFLRRGEPAVV